MKDYAEAIRQLFLGNTKPRKPTMKERIRESIRQDFLAATRRRLLGVG